MKKYILILFILSSFLFARIPIDNTRIRITSTFGEFRTDHFHNGVDFGGNRMEIYPIEDGEIVYYHDEYEDPTRPVYGVGNILMIEHPDSVRSYYYHIEPGTIEKSYAKVTEKDVVALTGNSGRSGGAHLHLTIENMKEGLVIDPLEYLKITKGSDQAPLIHGIYLRTENRLIQIKDKMSMRYNGEIKLFVKAYDLLGSIPMGLKRVKIYMNDELVRDYDFTYFIKRDNVYYISPKYTFEEVYGVDSHFYRGGVFIPKRGKYTFKAEVTDFDNKSVVLTRTVNFY
ncbi:M23 family metallopeptidase [uncultured Brachyspira sp.]|uniref:M23 family metallopeptidase n=1 Tax=uncultured Brachyspira sp. TaxID=221953 RepID=UPI00263373BD|nr:M23 family metallopeptidase [uncultured Brachyspira sp.]